MVLERDPEVNLIVASGFRGWVDDVRFGGVRSAEPVQLPEGFTAQGRPIRLSNGRLDPLVHAGPETLTIRTATRAFNFTVGQNGTVLAIEETEIADGSVPLGQKVERVQPTRKKE